MDKLLFMKRVFAESKYALTSPYGYRVHPITRVRTFHYGEDYGTYGNKVPVYSPVYGVVTESTYNVIRGNYVTVKTAQGYVRMQHLNSKSVGVGRNLIVGEQIGVCGTTGSSTGVHLHIEYKTLANGKLDPAVYVPSYADPSGYKGTFPSATISKDRGTYADKVNWQKFLNWYGIPTKVDGLFGTQSEENTKQFQRENGLFVDGSAGTNTRIRAKAVKR